MFAVIYSLNTGRIRFHTSPGLTDTTHILVGAGCAMKVYDDALYGDLNALQAQVSADTGLIPTNDRYAVINSAVAVGPNVTAAIHADPIGCGDTIPGRQLIPHPAAGPGWTYTPGPTAVWTPPTVTASVVK